MLGIEIPKEVKDYIEKLPYEYIDGKVNFIVPNGKTTLAKILTRHFKLKTKGYKDNEIRDISEQLELTYKKPQIKYCKTPEDYTALFEIECSSCVKLVRNIVSDLTKEILNKYNLYASMLYHYCPYTQGVWYETNKPIARSFIIDNKFYTYIYGPYSQGQIAVFEQELINLKLSKNTDLFKYFQTQHQDSFRIPGIETSKGIMGPQITSDFLTYDIKYDKETNEFVYKIINGGYSLKIFSAYDHWICSTACKVFKETNDA